MERIGDITGIFSLLMLAVQDFRSRRIAWWLLPLFVTGIILVFSAHGNGRDFFYFFSLNLFFLVLQFIFLSGWYFVKNKKFTRIIDSKLGLGDVLFLVCIATMFSPGNFLLVYTSGMLFSLCTSLLIKFGRRNIDFEIPLAGLLAIPLIALCIWRLADPSLDFYNDDWLLAWFSNTN